jgi:hypothetical protein
MKRILVIFILIIGLANIVKADTCDFWHVYYNDVKIKEFAQYSNNKEITLKIKDIKNTDSLTIMYFNDFHYTIDSTDCMTEVEFEDSNKFVILKGYIMNKVLQGAPLKISIFDLLVSARKSPFFAYYYACTIENRPKILLFKIEFE